VWPPPPATSPEPNQMAIKVPITRPQMSDVEANEASRVVLSGWLTQGPEVAAFEKEFAETVGAPHAVAVANCTVALELALRCLNIGRGDDVITVSHSFIASANCVIAVGARPIFVDVEADTYGMDPALLEKAITKNTKAILCVHQIGIPCDLEKILEVAKKHNLPVIEDAACAIGSEVSVGGRWEKVGKPHGLIACFSMHPRKIVTTGDGGMLTTNDAALAARMKLLRQHAMNIPDTVRHHSDKVMFESYTEPAYNYRLTDLQAAVGRPQLRRLPEIVKERRRLADRYKAALEKSSLVSPPNERATGRSNWQSYPLTIKPGAKLSQVEILQALMDSGVAAKRGIMNSHQEPAYADASRWGKGSDLTVSERARDNTILIPLFHGMTEAEQDHVIQTILKLG